MEETQNNKVANSSLQNTASDLSVLTLRFINIICLPVWPSIVTNGQAPACFSCHVQALFCLVIKLGTTGTQSHRSIYLPCPSTATSYTEADTAPAFKAQNTPFLTLILDLILMSWPSFDSSSLVCPETWISPFHEADSSQLCRKTACSSTASPFFDRFAKQGYHPLPRVSCD